MRIAIFYNLEFGGAKRVVMEHAKGLSKKGHVIDLYTINWKNDAFDPSAYCKNTYKYEIKINSSYPLIGRFIKDYKNFFVLKKLNEKIAADIDSRKYDLALIHPDKYTQAPFLLRFLKTKSVYYCQEPLRIAYEYSMRLKIKVGLNKKIYEELTRLYRKKIDRDNARSSSKTIASCLYVRERMIEAYELYPKIIYCGVDEKIFHPLYINKKNIICFVGSPTVYEDGLDLVQKALFYLPAKIRPDLHIISWKKLNGERLLEEDLVNIYNISIVTLCTSRLETFGLVPLESMACGTPVIATNISGHRETIKNKQTGYLVEFNSKEIASKIRYLIENPKNAREMSENARKHIEKIWTWNKIIDELEKELLQSIDND